MKILSLFACVALTATANAQFSVSSGIGNVIPLNGTGDSNGWDINNIDHDTSLTAVPGTASVMVLAVAHSR